MIRKEMNFLKGILLFRLQHQRKSASNRKVPLTDAVIAAFMSWKEKQDRDKEKLGKNWGKTNILLKNIPV